MSAKDKEGLKPKTTKGSSRFVYALNHPLRRQILRHMLDRNGPVSPAETSGALESKLGNVAYHFRALEEAKAIALVHTRQVRGTVEHFYGPSAVLLQLPWVNDLLEGTTD